MRKLFIQAFVGLLVVIAAFVGGAYLDTVIHGAGGKYLSSLGEFIVAALIFITTLALAILAHFKRGALFLTVGLTIAFEISVLFMLYGWRWHLGMYYDMREIWSHTFLPVGVSAVVYLLIRIYHERRHAA